LAGCPSFLRSYPFSSPLRFAEISLEVRERG
jgi:hypothetical protein